MDWLSIGEWIIRILSIAIIIFGFLREHAKNAKTQRGLKISQDVMNGAREILRDVIAEAKGAPMGIKPANRDKSEETQADEEEPTEIATSQETPKEPVKQEDIIEQEPIMETSKGNLQSIAKERTKEPETPAEWLKVIYETAINNIQAGNPDPIFSFMRDYVSQIYYKEYKKAIGGDEDNE